MRTKTPPNGGDAKELDEHPAIREPFIVIKAEDEDATPRKISILVVWIDPDRHNAKGDFHIEKVETLGLQKLLLLVFPFLVGTEKSEEYDRKPVGREHVLRLLVEGLAQRHLLQEIQRVQCSTRSGKHGAHIGKDERLELIGQKEPRRQEILLVALPPLDDDLACILEKGWIELNLRHSFTLRMCHAAPPCIKFLRIFCSQTKRKSIKRKTLEKDKNVSRVDLN